MVLIRRTTVDDADLLREIRLAALRNDPSAFGASYAQEADYEPHVWRDRAAGGDGSATFVAVDGEGAVGLVTGLATEDRPDTVELVSMWTAPSARGRGVGTHLVDTVLDWADSRGASVAGLWVMRGNDSAVRLYERCGFEVTDASETSPSDPCRNEIRMHRLRSTNRASSSSRSPTSPSI